MTHRTKTFVLLLLLLAGSGCAALIYEVTWYQELQLAIGSTAVSLGILLATFMGGLAIGSLIVPRLTTYRLHAFRIFATLEAGIGLFGVIVTAAMPGISRLYLTGAEHGLPGMLLRGCVAALAMLPSTILMGASLPVLVRGIPLSQAGVSRWALLYGSNTAGAVTGCLLAGFYFLRVYNMAETTYAAAAINLLVAVSAWALSKNSRETEVSAGSGQDLQLPRANAPLWIIYAVAALSGACALGAEVVWTRLLSILFMATVYAFSVILAVFLAGLAIGAAISSWFIRKTKTDSALGWCQVLVAAGIAWAAIVICLHLPAACGKLVNASVPHMFLLDLVFAVWAIFPAALAWGASFPLACAAAVRSPKDDPARVAGGIYAANTAGSIAGALAVSLVLIPWIGTQQSQRVLLVLAGLSAFLVLLAVKPLKASGKKWTTTALTLASFATVWLTYSVPRFPPEAIAFGRSAYLRPFSEPVYMAEGRNSSVVIMRWSGNDLTYISVNGHVEATTEQYDMRLQRMVAHLPGLAHPNPKSVLGIGFGAGVTAGSFTRYPGIERITICEIEPVIPPGSARFFAQANYDVYHDPRTRIVYDDARHYLLTTRDKFDIIASDPLDVFAKGTAALYTREYFEAVKQRLNPGGMFSLYVPLYETDEPTIRSELATFFAAFPNATLWSNTRNGEGYDMVFMARTEPSRLNVDQIEQRLARPGYAGVLASLRDIGMSSALDLFSTYAGENAGVGRWSDGAEINTDANLRLSYLAGMAINSVAANALWHKIAEYRGDPMKAFTGSPATIQALKEALYRQSQP